MREGGRRLAAALGLAIAVLGPGLAAPSSPPGLDLTPGRALLATGPDPVLGLPFFGPNAIPALRGSYRAAEGGVELWFTREPLVFGPPWSPERGWPLRPGGRAWTGPGPEGSIVLAESYGGWSLLLELPDQGPGMRRFVAAFLERFAFFLDNARSEAEVSFPAILSY